MKKWILVFILLSIFFALIYLAIPNKIEINQAIKVAANGRAFSRVFPNQERWSSWWPETVNRDHDTSRYLSFVFKGNVYRVIDKRLTSILMVISTGKYSLLSELIFIPLDNSAISLSWIAKMNVSNNPLERVKDFFIAKALAEDMQTILQNLNEYYSSEKNIYGLEIKKEYVRDSLLISSFFTTPEYPSVANIYSLVDRLKSYVDKNGARQTGEPMLNITTRDSVKYETRVALPVDKKLKDSGDIVYRWMLGRGDILVTEVVGGNISINKAFTEMEQYVTDYRRAAPAIPFQSLITDRRQERDSSKWITKIYWPVM